MKTDGSIEFLNIFLSLRNKTPGWYISNMKKAEKEANECWRQTEHAVNSKCRIKKIIKAPCVQVDVSPIGSDQDMNTFIS